MMGFGWLLAGVQAEHLGLILLVFCCAVAAGLGLAGMVALLRVVLPGVARAADRAARHGRTRNIGLLGLLPLVGALLLGAGVKRLHSQAAEGAFAVLVGLPLMLFLVAGALGAVPFIGRRILHRGDDAGVLRQSLGGGLVLGLTCTTAALPPLGWLVFFLLLGWLLSIGLGALKSAPLEPSTEA